MDQKNEQVYNSNNCATYKLIKTTLKFETFKINLPSYLATKL